MRKITLAVLLMLNALIYGQDFRFGKVSEEELQEEAHPKDPDANAAVLYREQYSHIEYSPNDGFTLTTEIFQRIKIYNKDGFDWGTHVIPVFVGGAKDENVSNLRAVTYTLENGKIEEYKLGNDGIFKEERSKNFNVEKFTMPNLQPGCIVEFRYKFFSPYLSTIDKIRFQEEIPVNKAELTFESPEWLVFQLHRKGLFPLDIQEKNKADKINFTSRVGAYSAGLQGGSRGTLQSQSIDLMNKTYSIKVEDVPAMREEAFSSNIDNYRAAVSFELSYTKFPNEPIETVTSSWEAVCKTIYDSENFGGQLKSDRYFDDDIDEILRGVSDSKEKLVRIFEYAKRRMTWNGYLGIYADEGTRSAYKNGSGNSGDINLNLVNMLRYAGLDANPVILSTRDNGIPIFPTRNGFNHVIAGVVLDGNVLLMDATNKIGAVNLLEEGLLNWNGRLIREDGTSGWVSLNPSSHALENTMVNAEIDENFALNTKVRSQFTGHYGLRHRKNLGGKDEQEQLEAFEEKYSGIELNKIEIKNLENPYEPVQVSYDFAMENGVERVGDKVFISPLMHLASQETPFKSEQRQHPVDFGYPWKDRYIITIKLPEGYNVETLPENGIYTFGDDMGSFKYLISSTNNTIQVSTEMVINSSIITPDLYKGLKEFYTMVVSKENEKVVLIKI
ncbi:MULTISPECIES: DUF3858 domain-containing protein [unclassified Leeuwenhoekiella]|uniref:DUF3858 domain-containing protein n=1 Tax=unclassified Leeuwenhoekiella TaxID=2615029 RepID=UPI000C4EB91E|nr:MULTISPECIES: DUF3858 domain-containing protein [unclassified Leeuwenhoekiella]MAW96474.1 transglutaminase [Leeuwenhoekiella sp.]MBA81361.1 transglutaminase [Leeuwenhoekiella sp.]|tara:strand:+ start:6336 stop:8351 length:2016 start_codon:yes stop_codon:yes gene_type:complete